MDRLGSKQNRSISKWIAMKGEIMGKRSNGEGTIYKRKDGRWCASYFDNNYNRHSVYGKTQAEVKKKLKEKRNEQPTKQQVLTMQEWIFEFLQKYKKNELKITTFDSYMGMYRKHIKDSALGKVKIDKVTTEALQRYYNDKIKIGYSSKTVREIETIINSALNMAVKLRMISENPNIYTTLPKKVRYEAKVLNREEVNRVIAEAKEEELYPIIITAIFTGMRKGEIMALKWNNVDFQGRKIYVKYSLCRVEHEEPDEKGHRHIRYKILEPKTQKSIRMIPMLDEVYYALIEQKSRQDVEKEKYKNVYVDQGFVFADQMGNYLPQRQFMYKYHKFLETYGITNIRFHDLRHTFSSLLIDADVSIKVIQELLGHSTITTSMDIYTHISDKKKQQALDRLQEI